MSRLISDRLAKTMLSEIAGPTNNYSGANWVNATTYSAPARPNQSANLQVRQQNGSVISAKTLRNRRRRANQRRNRQTANTTKNSVSTANTNRNKQGGNNKSNKTRVKAPLAVIEEYKGSDLANPERGFESKARRGEKQAIFRDLNDKRKFLKSAIFPELGDPQKFPGMGLTAVGKYWTSLTLTSTGTAISVAFTPQDFNAANNGWLGYSLTGNQASQPTNNSVQIVPPYPDNTILERARVTSACMLVSCVNPESQNASGVVAVSYQGGQSYTVAGGVGTYSNNLSQRDIEQSVTSYNGSMGSLNETHKAIWLPMDSSDMCFMDSGHAYYGKNFIGCYISNTNVNTTFRIDVYLNYEYKPGQNIEDVVTVTAPVLTEDPGLWHSVYKTVTNTGSSFLSGVTDADSVSGKALKMLVNGAASYFGGPGAGVASDTVMSFIQPRKDSILSDFELF